MEFCIIVKRTRKELGLSQEQLARELGVIFSTINRWKNEKSHSSQMTKELFTTFAKAKHRY